MTFLGKAFVVAVVVMSLLCCSYALMNYTGAVNFGWQSKYARKEGNDPIPSELDKRKPVLDKLAKEKGRAVTDWVYARDNLAQTESRIAENQLQYTRDLERLQSGKDFDIKSLKRNPKTGQVDLDPKTGRPELDKVVAKRSYDRYLREWTGIINEMNKTQDEIQKTIAKEQALTEELNGKGGRGLYALIDVERDVQKRARAEMDDLKPRLFQTLVDSELRKKRNRALTRRRDELKKFRQKEK
jgi:hypothetical protein